MPQWRRAEAGDYGAALEGLREIRAIEVADLELRLTDVMVEVAGCPPEVVSIVFEDVARGDRADAGRLFDEQG